MLLLILICSILGCRGQVEGNAAETVIVESVLRVYLLIRMYKEFS